MPFKSCAQQSETAIPSAMLHLCCVCCAFWFCRLWRAAVLGCRLYAVGFATRQLTANISTCTSSSSSLRSSASSAQQDATHSAYDVLFTLAVNSLATRIGQGGSSSGAQRTARTAGLASFVAGRVLLPALPLLDEVLLSPSDPLVPLQVGRPPYCTRALHAAHAHNETGQHGTARHVSAAAGLP